LARAVDEKIGKRGKVPGSCLENKPGVRGTGKKAPGWPEEASSKVGGGENK